MDAKDGLLMALSCYKNSKNVYGKNMGPRQTTPARIGRNSYPFKNKILKLLLLIEEASKKQDSIHKKDDIAPASHAK